MRSGEPRFDFDRNAWVGVSPFGDGRRTDAPAPGLWSRDALPQVSNRAARTVVVAVAIVPVPLAFALHLWPVLFATLGALLFLRELPKTRTASKWPLTDADRRLLEDPDDRDVCLVYITIFRDAKRIGSDKGVVWFEGGRLLYSGHRTSFALGGEDVLPAEERYAFLDADGASELGSRSLPLRVPEGRAFVRFEPLSYGDANEMRFVRRFHRFRADPPASRGPRQWPPLEP